MKNRFNQNIRPGITVRCHHPRGGTITGTVERLETVRDKCPDTRRFVRAYGPGAIVNGSRYSLDGCTPV